MSKLTNIKNASVIANLENVKGGTYCAPRPVYNKPTYNFCGPVAPTAPTAPHAPTAPRPPHAPTAPTAPSYCAPAHPVVSCYSFSFCGW